MSTTVQADEVNVAVAANFTAAMKQIVDRFERATGHRAVVSYASTGKLYTQILNGAPYDVFLSADRERALALEKVGLASGRITYANGKLVLWSRQPGLVDAGIGVLKGGHFAHLAMGNPKTAPYGTAARHVLKTLGLYEVLASKIVYGDSIAQTYQFVATGNAELGFVALAQTAGDTEGSRWEVPQALYDTIHQDAVLLTRGTNNPGAVSLMRYLKSAEAKRVIETFGYALP